MGRSPVGNLILDIDGTLIDSLPNGAAYNLSRSPDCISQWGDYIFFVRTIVIAYPAPHRSSWKRCIRPIHGWLLFPSTAAHRCSSFLGPFSAVHSFLDLHFRPISLFHEPMRRFYAHGRPPIPWLVGRCHLISGTPCQGSTTRVDKNSFSNLLPFLSFFSTSPLTQSISSSHINTTATKLCL